jgi:hypothetical protein
MAVDIIVEFDDSNGVVKWTLRTIDPATGELPEDAYVGFLPPNDDTGRGEGHVTFSIRSQSDLTPETVILNTAEIIFDTEAPISTNEVFNTIAPPVPSVPVDPGISDGATDVSISTAFSWAASESATSYGLYLWDLLDLSRPETPAVTGLETPFYDPPVDLEYGTTYLWQVVARNAMGEAIGLMWEFTTEVKPTEPIIPEPTTVLLLVTGLLGIVAFGRKARKKRR